MKCYIALVYADRHSAYPDVKYIKELGHDVNALLQRIVNEFYGGESCPLVQRELDFITSDQILQDIIRILIPFGRIGRAYDLGVVSGNCKELFDPTDEWEKLESTVEDPAPYLDRPEVLYQEYYPRVHSRIIAKVEHLVRAIALQFTVGSHRDLKS